MTGRGGLALLFAVAGLSGCGDDSAAGPDAGRDARPDGAGAADSNVRYPPEAIDDAFEVTEDGVLDDSVLANDLDADGDPLTAIVERDTVNGTLTFRPDGTFSYEPDDDFVGSDSFTYRARDPVSQSSPATVMITVTAVDDPPAPAPDSFTVAEDSALVANVGANDVEVDGDALTFTLLTGAAHGVLSLTSSGAQAGTVTYTPAANYVGGDGFSYRVSDGTTTSAPVTATIDVTPVNDPPGAVADAYITSEETPLSVAAPGVLANDSDPEGALLTASLYSAPPTSQGTVILNADGSFTFTPATNFFGTVSFSYRTYDGTTYSAPATVTITVTGVPDAPVANADAYTADENGTLAVAAAQGVLANDTDPDGTSGRTARVLTAPASGTLSLASDGSFTYQPAAAFVGNVTFTYEVSDGALTASATVTITVRDTWSILGAARAGGTNDEETGDVASLSDGTFFVTGAFGATATFGAGSLVSAGSYDPFLARYDAAGALVWAIRAGGVGDDRARAVAALSDGSTLVTGIFNGTAVFGAGEPQQTTLTAVIANDGFLARFASNGTLVWARQVGGAPTDVAVLADGSVFLVGSFTGLATFGTGDPLATTLSSSGGSDGFLCRYNADGTLAWARRGGGTSNDGAMGVAVSTDAVFAVGFYQSIATFGTASLSGTGTFKQYLLRYALDGTFAWAVSGACSSSTHLLSPQGIAALSDGTTVVTGDYYLSAVFGSQVLTATTYDAYVVKYSSTGVASWARRLTGSGTDTGQAVAFYADGTIAATGGFRATGTYDPVNLISAGGSDVYLLHLGPDGTLLRHQRAGGTQDDLGVGVAILPSGGAVVVGDFRGTAGFGAVNLVSSGLRDVFVARFGP